MSRTASPHCRTRRGTSAAMSARPPGPDHALHTLMPHKLGASQPDSEQLVRDCAPSDTKSCGWPRSDASSIWPSSWTFMPWCSTFLPGTLATFTCPGGLIAQHLVRATRRTAHSIQQRSTPHLATDSVLIREQRQRLCLAALGLDGSCFYGRPILALELQLHGCMRPRKVPKYVFL